ncbi:hypothetical protein Cgig2_028617 [Carnegiea gigantea]|uniref:Nucleobase-ascorbate transporter 3 n=1 Tax=Carnegiea gigantea TaxID=171969 RepID=A0A9Q1K760_9CARY|nr:hypothetical protein Cgig2_028617 [Carnegiea gigantea]
MGETGDHHAPPPPVGAPPSAGMQMPLGAARGTLFQPQEQLQSLQYCIHSNPSWPQTCILAFQHYIVMLGTTALIANSIVPVMGGSRGDTARVIQSLLFMSGINTLLQTFIGSRLPAVMGPSYVYIIPVMSIINDNGSGSFDTVTEHQVANCTEIGVPMLVLLVLVQQYAKRLHERAHPILERYALLLCLGVVWAFAAILTVGGVYNRVKERTKMSCRTDHSSLISSAPWIKIPYPFQWGTPIFSASSVFGMMGAALVSSAETTGTFYAAARLSGATPPPAHVLSRSIGLQGISMLLDGLFGTAVGTTATVENVGLLGLTRVGSRRVVQVSTVFMIFFSIFAANGISFMQFTNNNSMRNMYVLGLSLFLGISIPYYFLSYTIEASHGPVNTGGGWANAGLLPIPVVPACNLGCIMGVLPGVSHLSILGYLVFHMGVVVNSFNDILNTLFLSPPTVAMIVGTLLDTTLAARDSAGDRGVPWWIPFQNRKDDVRNDEFYSLPLRINEFMPTRFIK